jgi:MFS family permease
MIFTRGVFLLFLRQVHKFSFTDIALYQSLYFISVSIFEIPTGYIGDKFKKEIGLILGNFILALQCILMILVRNNIIFTLSLAVLEGVGQTFISGTSQAYFYDILESTGNRDKYMNFNSKLMATSSILTSASIFLGGVISDISWNLVYISTAVVYIMSIMCILILYYTFKGNNLKEHKKIKFKLNNLLNNISFKPVWIFVFFYIGVSLLDGLFGAYFNFNQVILKEFNVKNSIISLFFSIVYFTGAGGYILAEKLNNYIKTKNMYIILTLIVSILFILMSSSKNVGFILVISVLICFIPEMLYILSDKVIQNNINSDYRSTMLSISSLIRSLSSALIYMIFGIIFDDFGIRIGLTLTGILIFSVFLIMLILNKKTIKITDSKSRTN